MPIEETFKVDNKRIAKNTLLLYFRMLVLLLINLYTARIVLGALGETDYGIYNVVGGIVVVFTVINGTLSSGTSRFLTFELGIGDTENLRKTFSAAFAMHTAAALIVLILSETVGLWFLNTQLVIPSDRMGVAQWVYQFSIITAMLSLTQVPYSASIISHERMDIYAWTGLAEGVFKLVTAFILLYGDIVDKLLCYGILNLVWNIGLQLYYRYFCTRNYQESKLTIVRDKKVYKKMLSFSFWDFGGAIGGSVNTQGMNFLLNIFFGVVSNAARGIAVQVESQLQRFADNFMTAVRPQIVKCYAVKDYNGFFNLIFESSKYSYFLLLMVTLPVFMECDYILNLWLVNVPKDTSSFLRMIMVTNLFRSLSRPVIDGCHATGNIKNLNLYTSFTILLTLPMSWIAFKLGYPPVTIFVIHGLLRCLCNFVELYVLKLEIVFSIKNYLLNIMLRCLFVTVLVLIIPTLVVYALDESFFRFCVSVVVNIGCVALGTYFLILKKEQRFKLVGLVKNKLRKK